MVEVKSKKEHDNFKPLCEIEDTDQDFKAIVDKQKGFYYLHIFTADQYATFKHGYGLYVSSQRIRHLKEDKYEMVITLCDEFAKHGVGMHSCFVDDGGHINAYIENKHVHPLRLNKEYPTFKVYFVERA